MWRPLPGWLLVTPIETEEQIGSIVVPQQTIAEMTRTQYEVVASGGASVPDSEDAEPETPGEYAAGEWIVAPQRVAFDVLEERIMLLAERHVWAKVVG